MKRYLFLIFIKTISILTLISCYLNLPKFIALIFVISLRKNKLIKYSKKINKTIIVLDKSFGNDDLISAFKNNDSKIEFLMMQRRLIRVIFDYYFGKIKNKKFIENNTLYFSKNKIIIKQQLKYRDFLFKIFEFVFALKKIDGFLSFNLFYITDFELQNVSLKLNKKFLVSHKESIILIDEVQNMLPKYWSKRFKFSNVSAVNVYNNYTKKNIFDSRVLKSNNIFVSGMPRTDQFYSNKQSDQRYILFLMYQHTAGLPCPGNEWIKYGLKTNIKKFTWEKNANLTTKYILDYAKKNPDKKFIFKTKPGFSKNQINLVNSLNLKNCKLIVGGGNTGELIRNSSIIIGLNTTGLLEGMILDKNLITTNFENSNKSNKEIFIFKPRNLVNYITDQKKFFILLDKLSTSKIKLRPNAVSKRKMLKKHFVFIDGKSGTRFRKFLYKNIN